MNPRCPKETRPNPTSYKVSPSSSALSGRELTGSAPELRSVSSLSLAVQYEFYTAVVEDAVRAAGRFADQMAHHLKGAILFQVLLGDGPNFTKPNVGSPFCRGRWRVCLLWPAATPAGTLTAEPLHLCRCSALSRRFIARASAAATTMDSCDASRACGAVSMDSTSPSPSLSIATCIVAAWPSLEPPFLAPLLPSSVSFVVRAFSDASRVAVFAFVGC